MAPAHWHLEAHLVGSPATFQTTCPTRWTALAEAKRLVWEAVTAGGRILVADRLAAQGAVDYYVQDCRGHLMAEIVLHGVCGVPECRAHQGQPEHLRACLARTVIPQQQEVRP
jgi:hypothetical protein